MSPAGREHSGGSERLDMGALALTASREAGVRHPQHARGPSRAEVSHERRDDVLSDLFLQTQAVGERIHDAREGAEPRDARTGDVEDRSLPDRRSSSRPRQEFDQQRRARQSIPRYRNDNAIWQSTSSFNNQLLPRVHGRRIGAHTRSNSCRGLSW